MAVLPYFVLGPNALLSLAGLAKGPDRTAATPSEDWRHARVDVVIPAFNESPTIVMCLAGLLRQTMRPRRMMLMDDGSTDGTIAAPARFANNGVELLRFTGRSRSARHRRSSDRPGSSTRMSSSFSTATRCSSLANTSSDGSGTVSGVGIAISLRHRAADAAEEIDATRKRS